jgi:hypothetical protein
MESGNSDFETLKAHLNVILKPIDTNAVQESTEILTQSFKSAECVPLLMQLMINEEDQALRQIACIYLRRFLSKLWAKLDKQIQNEVKVALLERFKIDPIPIIKRSIAGVIGSISKILIPNKEWNELFEFVLQHSQSDSVADQEIALLLLSVLVEYFGKEEIKAHFDNISIILQGSLKSEHESIVDFGISCIKNFAKATNNVKVLKSIQKMIPDILSRLSEDNEDRIQAVFDCLLSLVEYKGLLTPHIINIIYGAIKIAANEDYHIHTRERAIVFFEFAPIKHFKTFKSNKKLLNTVIETLMRIACESDEGYQQDSVTPHQCALYSIKSFSIYMHKPIIFPIIIKNINTCIGSTNP